MEQIIDIPYTFIAFFFPYSIKLSPDLRHSLWAARHRASGIFLILSSVLFFCFYFFYYFLFSGSFVCGAVLLFADGGGLAFVFMDLALAN